jgi:hypothetical protein
MLRRWGFKGHIDDWDTWNEWRNLKIETHYDGTKIPPWTRSACLWFVTKKESFPAHDRTCLRKNPRRSWSQSLNSSGAYASLEARNVLLSLWHAPSSMQSFLPELRLSQCSWRLWVLFSEFPEVGAVRWWGKSAERREMTTVKDRRYYRWVWCACSSGRCRCSIMSCWEGKAGHHNRTLELGDFHQENYIWVFASFHVISRLFAPYCRYKTR